MKEAIAETEAYFEVKDKAFYNHGIEKLEKHWNDCIALEGDYTDFWPKKIVFLSKLHDLLIDGIQKYIHFD